MARYAYLISGIVHEVIDTRGEALEALYTPDFVGECVSLEGVGEVEAGWSFADGVFSPPPPRPQPLPRSISRRQFILALLGAGLIEGEDALAWAQSNVIPPAFNAVLDTLNDDEARAARITLMTMAEAERDSPLLAAVIDAGLATAEQVDDVFRAGALI